VEPFQLGDGSAPDRIWITEESQRAALSELLAKRLSDPGAPDGIARFARWYAGSFNKWFDDAILVNLVAKGAGAELGAALCPGRTCGQIRYVARFVSRYDARIVERVQLRA
jgi:hypothetical protein